MVVVVAWFVVLNECGRLLDARVVLLRMEWDGFGVAHV